MRTRPEKKNIYTEAFKMCILFTKFQIKEGAMIGTCSTHGTNTVIRNQKPIGRPGVNGNIHFMHWRRNLTCTISKDVVPTAQ